MDELDKLQQTIHGMMVGRYVVDMKQLHKQTGELRARIAALEAVKTAAGELMDLHYKDEGVSWMAKDDRPFIEYCALFDVCLDKLAAALDAAGDK